MREPPLSSRLLRFAVSTGKFIKHLPHDRFGNHIAGQLIRCGSSPAANYAEAQAAESKKDFIHKLGICLKELRETSVWLKLVIEAGILPPDRVNSLLGEALQLGNIIAQSIITAKRNPQNRNPTRSTLAARHEK